MAAPFRAELRRDADAVSIVLHGDVDVAADPGLPDAYAEATQDGARTVILDFSDTGYMNSTGIALVVELLSEALRSGRSLRAAGLSPHYREIFAITRLSDHIAVLDPEPVPSSPAGGKA
jgi:anti-sigma B factor antagonist